MCYKTALGVFALRVANGGNTVAGIIGAQTGTEILHNLSEEAGGRGITRAVFVPRGTAFRLVFLAPARVGAEQGSESEPGTLDRLRAEQEQMFQELSQYFHSLEARQPAADRRLGLDNLLKNPEVLDDLEVPP